MNQTSGASTSARSSLSSSWASSHNSNMTTPSHYRPYSVALKETPPLIAPRFQNSNFSNINFSVPQHSAFLPPAMFGSSSKSSTNPSSSSSCAKTSTTVPLAPQLPSSNPNSNTQGSKVDPPVSTYQRENAHLNQVNKDLLERVRQWEAWYMMARHELDACAEAQARAIHWQAQAEEMQRQKAVLMARVRRWQQRWAMEVAVKKNKVVKISKNRDANSQKENPKHTSSSPRKGVRIVSGRPTTPMVQMPLLKRSESKDTHESHPRPFKKRCFGSSSNGTDDSSLPSSAIAQATKTQKVLCSALNVSTCTSLSTSSSSNSRCLTPNDDSSTNVASVTPSPQVPDATFEG